MLKHMYSNATNSKVVKHMHSATHYATFATLAQATTAHAQLHTALNNKAHVVLQRDNTVHVTRTFKQHKKAVKFVDNTIELFWEVCNDVDDDAEGNSDVVDDMGYSSY